MPLLSITVISTVRCFFTPLGLLVLAQHVIIHYTVYLYVICGADNLAKKMTWSLLTSSYLLSTELPIELNLHIGNVVQASCNSLALFVIIFRFLLGRSCIQLARAIM